MVSPYIVILFFNLSLPFYSSEQFVHKIACTPFVHASYDALNRDQNWIERISLVDARDKRNEVRDESRMDVIIDFFHRKKESFHEFTLSWFQQFLVVSMYT